MICFSIFYIITLILKLDFSTPGYNLRYIINYLIINLPLLITPILILTLILTHKKDYKFKPFLFPVAFGVSFVLSLITQIFNISNMKSVISLSGFNYAPIYLCSFLICLANGLMFLGTLFSFKHIKLLKYGALGCAILYLCSSIAEFIAVGGFEYIQSVPEEYPAINILAFLLLISHMLFYIGIFVLIPNQKKTD